MEIPFGSRYVDNAAPCTAWGTNQKKFAVNDKGHIFSGYMDNDEVLGFTVFSYRYANWTQGVKLRTQRPGNVLLDRFGNVHVFVVDGQRLMHHVFAHGNVLSVTRTTKVCDGCNIRFSVDIRGPRIFVAFGHKNRMHFLDGYLMSNGMVTRWKHRVSQALPCNFGYPHALIRKDGRLCALAEENEPGLDKKYTMSCLFDEDHLDTPHVLEHYINGNQVHNEDLYEDSEGTLHVIVRIHPDSRHFIHAREVVPGSYRFARSRLHFPDMTHLRVTEDVIDGIKFIGTSWNRLWYCSPGDKEKDNITPAEVVEAGETCEGIVPFVVDDEVLLLPSAEASFPDAKGFIAHTHVNVPEYRFRRRAKCTQWCCAIKETCMWVCGRMCGSSWLSA